MRTQPFGQRIAHGIMVFSIGVARGIGDKDVDGRTELLASLKIM